MGGGEREKESEGWTEKVTERPREREKEKDKERERERAPLPCSVRVSDADKLRRWVRGGWGGQTLRRWVGEPDKPENALSQSLVAGLDFTRITQSRKAHLSNTNAPRPPRSGPPPAWSR